MTVYFITKERSVYHEGDERSYTHPGHGYPAYTEVVREATEYPDYAAFIKAVQQLECSQQQYKAYSAEQLIVTTTVVIDTKPVG